MAAAEANAALDRDGALLRLRGRLNRRSVPALWPQALRALDGAEGLDLRAVDAIDSAGLALLSALAERLAARGATPRIEGEPPGLAGLRAAYRMTPDLLRSQGST